jgi:8-oxo-dGTP pyrophosphatase MutT (NUDIX family)
MQKMQQIFCNNCGNRGHQFRECKKPVLSCGIILVRDRTQSTSKTVLPINIENIEVLMVRRKDSMAYTEFMRGKYDASDKEYVKKLLENMTQSELQNLKSNTFETLWVRMFHTYSDKNEIELKNAKEKYDSIVSILDTTVSTYTEPEWGFPKGRRFRCEGDQDCAEREFFEETNIPRNAYIIIKDITFKEVFQGTNGIPYEHKYFLGVLTKPTKFHIHQKFTTMQKREISAIGWKTLLDCNNLTRPHYVQRESLLNDLRVIVTTIEVWISSLEDFDDEDNGDICT